ncbi:MAG: hypothetical protein ABSF24_06715 [Candidatus Bathyarchaeia archaeon]|jgi:hypothetical protein
MPKKKSKSKETARLNLYLDPDLAKKLNDYCLAYMEKHKKIIESIRQMVGRMALAEWLQNHGDDFTVEL